MNNITPAVNYLYNIIPVFQNKPTVTLHHEFLNAINENNLSQIQDLSAKHPEFLNKPLPNNELPLIYAIRESKAESTQLLLKLGCDPSQNDDQSLNAVSMACFKEEYDLAAQMMHGYISMDVEAGRDIKAAGPSAKALQMYKTINTLNTYTKERVLPNLEQSWWNQSIFADKSYIQQVLDLVNQRPILNISQVANNSVSYLHTAILIGDKTIVKKLLDRSDCANLLNFKDSSGMSPLHYAAATGRLDLMKLLVEKGATLQTENVSDISPVELLAAKLNEKNPLDISKHDIAIFLCSTILWSAQLLPAGAVPTGLLQALQLAKYATLIPASISYYDLLGIGIILGQPVALFLSNLSNGQVDNIFFGVNALLTANLAYYTFKGLQSCWRNASLGQGKAMLKAVVSYAPKVSVSYSNLRSIGSHFGILSPQAPDALSQLRQRNSKCSQNGPRGTLRNICLDKSEDVYLMCTDAPDSSECFAAQESYDSFIDRIIYWKENEWGVCDKVTTATWMDCYDKRENWKTLCGMDFESESCLNAEKILKDGQKNGFEQPKWNSNWDNGWGNNWGNEWGNEWGKYSHTTSSQQGCEDAVKSITGNADSSLKEFKKAFRLKAIKAHPDKGGTEAEMLKLNEAKDKVTKCYEDKILVD